MREVRQQVSELMRVEPTLFMADTVFWLALDDISMKLSIGRMELNTLMYSLVELRSKSYKIL